MSHPAVSELAKSVIRLLPPLDPPYTQLTSDQITEIYDIKRDLTNSILVETQDRDYIWTDTANYATPNNKTVTLKVPKRADWLIDDPYLTRIYLHYGTDSTSKIHLGFDESFPSDVLATVKLIFYDTANDGVMTPKNLFFMHPFSTVKYLDVDTLSYTESSGDDNTNGYIGGLQIRKTIFWARKFQFIYGVWKGGIKIIDKIFTGNVKMHITIFKNEDGKAVREFSLHSAPLGVEDFITLNQYEVKPIVTNTLG